MIDYETIARDNHRSGMNCANLTNKLLYAFLFRMVSNVNYQVQFRKTSCYRDSVGWLYF